MPALSLAALKQQIADKRPATVYLFTGEDIKLLDRMVDGLESVVDEADRPFAVERLYAGEEGVTPLAIASAARVFPMLGDRRLVFVLRAERLLKPRRASKAAEIDEDGESGEAEPTSDAAPLEDYLASPVPSTTLVFVAAEIDRTRRLTKRVLESAHVVEFGGLAGSGDFRRGSPAADWLREEMVRAGRTLDPDAARLLVSRSGADITKLRADIERVLLYAEGRSRIGVDDVLEVVVDANAVEDEWAVVNAIAAGDAARALVEVGRRMDRGDSPHGLVGQLRWWVSQRLSEGGDASRVKAAIEALLRTDLALKSSGGDERVLVERLVVELTGRPLPAQQGWGRR